MSRPRVLPPDYERRVIEQAREALSDIPECLVADYKVRWPDGNPLLVIAFHVAGTVHQPAVGVALVTVRKGTLLDVLPGNTLLDGERLTNHIKRSVHDFLDTCEIRLPEFSPFLAT
jgi:hypothetical protein